MPSSFPQHVSISNSQLCALSLFPHCLSLLTSPFASLCYSLIGMSQSLPLASAPASPSDASPSPAHTHSHVQLYPPSARRTSGSAHYPDEKLGISQLFILSVRPLSVHLYLRLICPQPSCLIQCVHHSFNLVCRWIDSLLPFILPFFVTKLRFYHFYLSTAVSYSPFQSPLSLTHPLAFSFIHSLTHPHTLSALVSVTLCKTSPVHTLHPNYL